MSSAWSSAYGLVVCPPSSILQPGKKEPGGGGCWAFPPHPPRSSPCPSGCRRRRAPPGMNDDFRGFRCCFILLPLVSRLAASATEAAATYGVILEALAREFFESSPPKASFRQVPSKQKDTSKPIEVSLFIRIVIYYFIDFWVLI